MIISHSRSLAWIQEAAKLNRISDKTLLEKTIRALSLLEGLALHGIDFVFKGGTALMLMLGSTRRLSIDIDIVMGATEPPSEEVLASIASLAGFSRVELQSRKHGTALKKAHYKFWYAPSHITNRSEDYVLLDIVMEGIHYPQIRQIEIVSPFLQQEAQPVQVWVPTYEGILGDKLTAFAPQTTGIPYYKNGDSKSMEIIKQLFDIGCLYDKVESLEQVAAAFRGHAEAALLQRGLTELDVEHVLEDILETAFCICLRGSHLHEQYAELHAGVQRIQSFIFSENYHLEKVILHASKAANLALAIQANCETLHRWTPGLAMGNMLVMQPERNKVNKLKKSNPEAFFYWYSGLGQVVEPISAQG
ncbi:MAG: nucleotidyl transferase AbiEii/AbiGii toxin family protein [Bacteroidia bacterium]